MHVAWWAVHEVGVCHQWPADQWKHDPSGANQNSPKGINRDVGRGGLSAPELLHLGEHPGACSGSAPSSRPQAGACLRRKAHSEERGLEGGILVVFLDFLDLPVPKAATSLEFPDSSHRLPSLSWVSSLTSESLANYVFLSRSCCLVSRW